jgi:hypothetical protein
MLLLIALIALVTFIRAFDRSGSEVLNAMPSVEADIGK